MIPDNKVIKISHTLYNYVIWHEKIGLMGTKYTCLHIIVQVEQKILNLKTVISAIKVRKQEISYSPASGTDM